jgi:hypothetical protein
MHTQLTAWLRHMKRLPALLVIMALLLPSLLATLPAARADTPEQRLLADLAISACGTAGQADKGMPKSAPHDYCCILCSPLNHVTHDSADHPLLIKPALRIGAVGLVFLVTAAPLVAPPYREMVPRGPPTA